MEINNCLKKYSGSYYEDMFGLSNTKTIDSFGCASKFLSEYALNADEYQYECVPKMQKVFCSVGVDEFDICTSPVSMLFQPDFKTTLQISSPMFTEETYHLIQKICHACGDRYFYIVEDSLEDTVFQLKIPVTTSWEQLKSEVYLGSFIQHAI